MAGVQPPAGETANPTIEDTTHNQDWQLPSPALTASRPPHAGEFFGAAFSGSSHLPWPSPSLTSSALPCSPSEANLSTLQACPELVEGIHFMLRAAALCSFLRRLQRFSTSGRPETLAACYAAV
jgi:hypothetical protein